MSKVFFSVGVSLDGVFAPEGMELAHADDPTYKGKVMVEVMEAISSPLVTQPPLICGQRTVQKNASRRDGWPGEVTPSMSTDPATNANPPLLAEERRFDHRTSFQRLIASRKEGA